MADADAPVRNVLFLCTGNSARSIIAECVLNRLGGGRLRGYSAGSRPAGRVHRHTLALLESLGYATCGLRSKGWEEFAVFGAPEMDIVVTVCDRAAGETCPVWPGRPLSVHWSLPDPAAAAGTESEQRAAFAAVHELIAARIRALLAVAADAPDHETLCRRLAEINQTVQDTRENEREHP